MERKVLITGGVRSGKSRFAIDIALSHSHPRVFLATAEPTDQEMRERILCHQIERKEQFLTLEEPIDLGRKVLQMDFEPSVIIVDCLTLWLGNLYHHLGDDEQVIEDHIRRFVAAIRSARYSIVLVSNEVGLGLISDLEVGRRYVDRLGILNQELARACDEVVLMTCGIPQMLKGNFQNAKVDD